MMGPWDSLGTLVWDSTVD